MERLNYDEIFDNFATSFVGKEIKKDVILDKLSNNEDKEIIKNFINNIYIMYSIKSEVINKKADKNFSEIQIIEVEINNYRAIYDIYGILLSIIPYPILAIFKYKDRSAFAVSNRILADDRINKGTIYSSYLIKNEDFLKHLKIDIDSCQTMIDIYNGWISNIENVIAYYERLDRVIDIIQIGLRIKSNEVLEKLESYIARDCGTYNMKPKEGWKSKLEKYSDDLPFIKKVEIHILWEYLSENTFLQNKLEDFSDWNDFKETSTYNNFNNMYYSQFNSRMSNIEDIDISNEYIARNNRYRNHNITPKVEMIKSEIEVKSTNNNIEEKIKEIIDYFSEIGETTYSELDEVISKKFKKADQQIINKVLYALDENDIEISDDQDYDTVEYDKVREEVEKDFMLNAIKEDYNVLSYASDKLLNDKEFMLKAIEKSLWSIEWANEELLYNKDFLLKAINIDTCCIGYASDELKNDKEFMLKAIEINSLTIGYASDALKDNKDFMLQVIEDNDWCTGYASERLKNDKEYMLKAVSKNSWNIKYASDELKNDKDFMLKAIEIDGWCILSTNEDFRMNEDFMLEAIKLNSWSINLIPPILRNNEEFMLKAIKENYLCLEYISNELLSNSEIINRVFEFVNISKYSSNTMLSDENTILEAVKNGEFFCFANVGNNIRNNRELMLKAIKLNSDCIGYSSNDLLNDSDYMIEVITINPKCINFANVDLKHKKDFMLKAVEKDIWCMEYARENLLNDEDFVLQAIEKQNYKSLVYGNIKFRGDKEFMLKAIEKDIICYELISDDLRYDNDILQKLRQARSKNK